MEPFETVGLDGLTYLHYDNWQQWRSDRLRETPNYGNLRYDIELCHPRNTLREVPIDRNPHGFGQDGWTCYYCSNNWSVVHGVHDAHRHDLGEESLRMLVERGLINPWGERIELWCTSSAIENEPWGRNPSNRFAFFRGRFWKVVNFEPLQEWGPGRRGYTDGRARWGVAINPPEGWVEPELEQLWWHPNILDNILDFRADEVVIMPPPPLYFVPYGSAGSAIKSWENYQGVDRNNY